MKTTARILTGVIPVAFGLSVVLSLGTPWLAEGRFSAGTAIAGQTPGSALDEARRRSDDLLQRAGQALAENDLKAAESLISQAEALGVRYSPFHPGDTPNKLRRELERKLQATEGSSTLSGRLFAPLSITKDRAPVTDPFAGRTPAATNVRALPPVDPTSWPAPSASRSVVSADRVQSDQLLLAARRALAEGDLLRANEMVRKAKSLGVQYGPLDDSPAKVEAAIRSYGDLAAQRAERGHTEAYRSRFARILMDQAEGLLRHRDYDKAEQLAAEAARQRVSFGPYQANPQDLLQKITAARRASRPTSWPTSMARSRAPGSSAAAGPSLAAAKQQVRQLVGQARAALGAGDLARAESLARQAERFSVPSGAFELNEDRPDLVLLDIQKARMRSGSHSALAGGRQVVPATGTLGADRRASRAVYDPARDRTRNILANAQAAGTPTPAPPQTGRYASQPSSGMGHALFQQGEAALEAHDTARAMQYFRQAAAYSNELDSVTAQRLQDRLSLLGGAVRGPGTSSILNETEATQQRLFQQVAMDLARRESEARAMRETDPNGAMALLQETRQMVEAVGLEPATRTRMLARVDRALAETQQYIEQNRARIDLEEDNQRVLAQMERERQMELDVQKKLHLLTEEFNQLIDEENFAEAEKVAQRAAELDPDSPMAVQLTTVARLIRHHYTNLERRDAKEKAFWDTLDSVELASIPFDDREPIVFPDAKEWEALSASRKQLLREMGRRRTEQDLEIEQKLKTPVLLQFENAPLSQVIDYLGRMAGVNFYLDPQGLAQEGVSSDDAVNINFSQEIQLKSALNLILRPYRLGYVIKDEVLKITSEQLRDDEGYTYTYPVADLVIPIPNFRPGANMGLAGAYHDALGGVGFGGGGGFGAWAAPVGVVASRDGSQNVAAVDPTVLAQMPATQPPATPTTIPIGAGPGGLGGGAMADFDTLINLIKTTVQPETWDDVGGPGSIAEFPTNLSIVVSQRQDVHEEIAELLEQLRRMQDLQVTIEVRFLTLNDNFFERIGVDFDFDIDDDIDRPFQVFGRRIDDGDPATGDEPARNTLDVDHDRSVTVGLQAPNAFSVDLDIPFRQDHFRLGIPQFGGFDPTSTASLGFAILSDIEAFFFIEALQGDRRSNVLQAPKVTLFNGQQAFVSDTSQSPFVISVIPVVGDFAAAQQPVIVVLSEGTFLTVQAVVSSDRRFVRLTLVPFFSRIGEVNTFQFEGSETTTENTSVQGDQEEPNDNSASSSESTVTRSGTTVQLPTFSFVSVSTTVSVPDGGTVLMGGIKRLSEGRTEAGVPILSKLPYINRLFKNVGIGRETQSLMMMVTPRIIIQEEEEARLGIL